MKKRKYAQVYVENSYGTGVVHRCGSDGMIMFDNRLAECNAHMSVQQQLRKHRTIFRSVGYKIVLPNGNKSRLFLFDNQS